MDRFTCTGSGWNFQGIIDCTIHISQYRPLTPGSSFIESPSFIKSKRAVVNVDNADEKCFEWAVLSALHPVKNDCKYLYNYEKYEHTLNWNGIRFPTPLDNIRIFERNNTHITINCYQYKPEENHAIIPIYLTKYEARQIHIDLLLFSEGDKSHYTWIKKHVSPHST